MSPIQLLEQFLSFSIRLRLDLLNGLLAFLNLRLERLLLLKDICLLLFLYLKLLLKLVAFSDHRWVYDDLHLRLIRLLLKLQVLLV